MARRWIAYKLRIKDLINAKYTEDGFIDYKGLQVNRVRIMGSIVSKFISDDKKYGFIVVDDGTETIRVRGFEDTINLIEKTKIGDIVDVIGRVRFYENEIYIVPEIIKKVDDPNFEILRKVELIAQDKKLKKAEERQGEKGGEVEIVEEIVQEEIVSVPKEQKTLQQAIESPRKKIVDVIVKLDKGEGVEISRIIEESKLSEDVVETVLTELMNDGEIFEPRPGKVKII